MGGAPAVPNVVPMFRNTPPTDARRLSAPLVVAAILALVTALTYPSRTALYIRLSGAVQGSVIEDAVVLLAERGLLLLIAVAAVLAILTWWRDRPAFVRLAAGGLGTVAAYASSEVIKTLVSQPRPCRTLDVATALTCPAATDWAWPSNHATIAASVAVACVLVAPRLWPVLVPLAAGIAVARVGAGVHYVHDVTAGLALGTLVTVLISTWTTRGLLRAPVVRRTILEPRSRAGI